MLDQLRKMLGLRPPLAGLEQILDGVRTGTIDADDAATQIRELAAQPHIPPWFPRVFRLGGAMFVLFGLGFAIHSATFSFGTKETEGTVIEMVGTTQESPVVEYDVAGQRFTFHSSISSSPPAYAVGDKVTMLYHPENPRRAQINSFHDRWLFPLVFTGAGLLVFGFSFALPGIVKNLTQPAR